MATFSFELFLIVALAGGWLMARLANRVRLPGMVGMLAFGLVLGALAQGALPALAWDLEPLVKSIALLVILFRAGLGIRRNVLARVGRTAILLAVVPATTEATVLTALLHWTFGLDWWTAGLAAWMLAAVSPAVIVPSMLELQTRKDGQGSTVPTMLMASAAVDDVVAITAFSAILVILTGSGTGPVWTGLAWMPLSILGGVALGVLVGLTLAWVFSHFSQRLSSTEKTLILLVVGLLLVEVGNWLALASLLAVMTVGFVLLERSEPAAQEAAAQLAKIWIPVELMLFVYIGIQVDPNVVLATGVLGLSVIVGGLLARALAVWWVTALDKRLSPIERRFCVVAFLPKATVQAALGGVALGLGIPGGEVILSLAVIAILFSAPLGLVLIRHLGQKLP